MILDNADDVVSNAAKINVLASEDSLVLVTLILVSSMRTTSVQEVHRMEGDLQARLLCLLGLPMNDEQAYTHDD
jgi:hypothetical protein